MDFGYIISNSLRYPLSDYKKLVILAIPAIVLQLMTFVVNVMGVATDELGYYASNSYGLDAAMVIVLLLFLLISILVTIITYGITIETIKKSFNSSQLPDFDIQRFFVSGLKYIIVRIGYFILPAILFVVGFVFLGLSSEAYYYSDASGVYMLIGFVLIIVALVAVIILALMEFVASARLAETNSLSEAFDISNIYNTAKQIGIGNIFAIIIIFAVIMGLIGMVFGLVSLIPLIGSILLGIATTYMLLASARMVSLVYQSRLAPQYNNMYQPGAPNYQSGYAGDVNNQQQGGYNQVPGGYYPPNQGYPPQQGYNQPQQGYNQPQQGYNQPQQGYNQPPQDYNQPQQGYNQQNPSQGYDDSQNYYQQDNNYQNDNNQSYPENDSAANDQNSNDLDFKNNDSAKDDKKPEN